MKLRNKGLSVLDVLLAAVLLVFLGFGIVNFLQGLGKAENTAHGAYSFDSVLRTLMSISNREELCSMAFRNIGNTSLAKYPSVDPAEQLGAVYLRDQLLVSKNQDLGNGISLTEMELRTVVNLGTAAGKKNYIVELMLKTSRPDPKRNSRVVEFSNESNPFRFKLQTNAATDVIETCAMEAEITTSELRNALKDLLQATTTKDAYICSNETYHAPSDPIVNVSVSCDPNFQLLQCTGGPGDLHEGGEAFWVEANFTTNTCTLYTIEAACTAAQLWTRQKITAACFPMT